MSEPEFVRLQRAFARHLRNPDGVRSPVDSEARRQNVYRHAIRANVEGFMRENYPRVHAAFDDAQWQDLISDYLGGHVSRANAFVDLPLEFLDYLENERDVPDDPPFLAELAHFDWLETLVGADERRVTLEGVDRDGDLLNGVPVANPVLELVTYRFPVHAIGADYRPDRPPAEPTRIAAFRDLDNLYGFLDLSGPAARLLDLVREDAGLTGEQIIGTVAREIGHADVDALLAAGSTIFERMRSRAVLLGTRRP